MFFTSIGVEILQICQGNLSVVQFIKTSKVVLRRMLRQEADPLGVKKASIKMVNRHIIQFEKYNANNRDLIHLLLT